MSVCPKKPCEWHIVGDSHVEAFRYAADEGLLSRTCRITSVGGATAVGLRNPNSSTDAISIFKNALLPCRPGTIPVVHLGEVDCGFVIWYRARKYGDSIEQQTSEAIVAYFDFVDFLIDAGFPTVVVACAVLPTIRDGQDWGAVANARREVKATLRERTDLTRRYNRQLAEEATLRSLPRIDITDALLDQKIEILGDQWRHPDPSDHHLDPGKTAVLWAERLNDLASRIE